MLNRCYLITLAVFRRSESNVHSICILNLIGADVVSTLHDVIFPEDSLSVAFEKIVYNFCFSLTENIRKQLNTKKDVWVNLPKQICDNHHFASQDNTASCWNGFELQR